MTVALEFERVTKIFRLQQERPRTFKELFLDAVTRSSAPAESLTALDDVSFSLEQGGTLGLLGPNGTGKSTVLKLAARILEPTAGRVGVRGRVAALLELGAGFHPDLTGRENVYLNGSLMGLASNQMAERLDAIVAFSELERFIDMPVKHYSSGMYMRLGFATAIHVDPDILLIDEVLAVGDQAFQHKCRDRIASLRRAGKTIVLVSHDVAAVRELCERSIWLQDGLLQSYGPTDVVADAYYKSMAAHEEARLAAEEGREISRAADETNRWGTGEVEITDVELLDSAGAGRHVFHTGEPLTIRVHYFAHRRVERPVIGLAIHRQDGVHITGPNTRAEPGLLPVAEGAGHLDYTIENLPLTDGTFEVSASCYDWDLTRPFDYHHRRFEFRVRSEGGAERFGSFVIPGTWH
jgi:lipopolysaccharide transport system ATP-binding protein